MPSQTIIVRAHTRTIYTRPVTFVCGKCGEMTTRECYPGKLPKYCIKCRPPKKRKPNDTRPDETPMFCPTHHLVALTTGQKTPVALVPSKQNEKGWYQVKTALDWFSGESIIMYHEEQGLFSRGILLVNYQLEKVN